MSRSQDRAGAPDGVVLIDKPRGPTSFDVVAEVRRRLGTRRVGHTGTLDPMATGLLPVCVGEGTKLVQFLTDCDKAYEAEVIFGVQTATGDAEGAVVAETDASAVTQAAVDAAALPLVGHIEQVPPMYSAIRIDGQRLHTLARAGIEVERTPRPIVVHALSLTELAGGVRPRYFMRIHCGKGTYVRVIAEDIGRALGVGAHLCMLRRTEVGRFRVADAVPLDHLAATTPIVGAAEALRHLPSLTLDAAGATRVRAGQERWLLGMPVPPGPGRSMLLGPDGALVAVISRTEQKIQLERVFVDKDPSSGAHTPDLKSDQNERSKGNT